MAEFLDFYSILELTPDASQEEIKKQWRRLAKFYHPDDRPDAQKEYANGKLALINQAHDTLGDPSRRAAYDQEYRQRVGGTAPGVVGDDPAEVAYHAAQEMMDLIYTSGFVEGVSGKVRDYRDRAVRQLSQVTERWPSSQWALFAQRDIMMLYATVARSPGLARKAALSLGRMAPGTEFQDLATLIIAGVYEEEGNGRRALELLRALTAKAVAVEARVEAQAGIARVLHHSMHDHRGAVAEYRRFVDDYPGHPYCAEARYTVARILDSDLHEYREAIAAYEEVIRLHPGTESAGDCGWRIRYIRDVYLSQQGQPGPAKAPSPPWGAAAQSPSVEDDRAGGASAGSHPPHRGPEVDPAGFPERAVGGQPVVPPSGREQPRVVKAGGGMAAAKWVAIVLVTLGVLRLVAVLATSPRSGSQSSTRREGTQEAYDPSGLDSGVSTDPPDGSSLSEVVPAGRAEVSGGYGRQAEVPRPQVMESPAAVGVDAKIPPSRPARSGPVGERRPAVSTLGGQSSLPAVARERDHPVAPAPTVRVATPRVDPAPATVKKGRPAVEAARRFMVDSGAYRKQDVDDASEQRTVISGDWCLVTLRMPDARAIGVLLRKAAGTWSGEACGPPFPADVLQDVPSDIRSAVK